MPTDKPDLETRSEAGDWRVLHTANVYHEADQFPHPEHLEFSTALVEGRLRRAGYSDVKLEQVMDKNKPVDGLYNVMVKGNPNPAP